MVKKLRLNRLLQLCSVNLPVGGFAFSQGLEFSVESGWLAGVQEVGQWIAANLHYVLVPTDLAVAQRLYSALASHDIDEFCRWDQFLLACRESSELRLADRAMGSALLRLLRQLDSQEDKGMAPLLERSDLSFTSAFVLAAWLWNIDEASTLNGFGWCFLENQVAAATKLVPLGQTQAQNLLFDLSEQIAPAVQRAKELDDDELGGSLVRVAMASAWHETQYTRLFRS